MMESALLKSGAETLSGVSERIRHAIASAIDAESGGGQWVFDRDPGPVEPEDVLLELEREYAYATMVERHSEAIAAFTGDAREQRVQNLARRALRLEWGRCAPELDVYAVGEFVFRTALNFVSQQAPHYLERDRLAQTVEAIAERLDESMLPMQGPQRNRYAREWSRAIEMVSRFACAGAKWQFTRDPDGPAPAPEPGNGPAA
jgi:hypothetical protein